MANKFIDVGHPRFPKEIQDLHGDETGFGDIVYVAGSATEGTTADAPNTDASSATPETAITLLKSLKNYIRGILTVKFDQTTPGTTNGVVASLPTSVSTPTVQVNAASVAATASSVPASTATGGKRWATVLVACNKAYTLKCYGHTASFSAITAASKLTTIPGVAAVSGYGADSYEILCAGHAHFGGVVVNDDSVNAATVSVSVSFHD